jgi:hypothetical protein
MRGSPARTYEAGHACVPLPGHRPQSPVLCYRHNGWISGDTKLHAELYAQADV